MQDIEIVRIVICESLLLSHGEKRFWLAPKCRAQSGVQLICGHHRKSMVCRRSENQSFSVGERCTYGSRNSATVMDFASPRQNDRMPAKQELGSINMSRLTLSGLCSA